ncbi:MAG: hypothetical protein LBH62_00840 [Nitrososphaerota archaeon]|uniref:hypothetical protein n=1 Tax=Candidatus Bathycorpusculum sp. TaxID=2994959 RepID=UPI0028304058|nr:hypothetical protein [Candidatus Termiticorpusculum sp.]MCL2257231.1 hypothetical protein [Candidatus Termiticorpusculum sp.]MCL2292629.1 hypothetical protein [Candidatus Termiticorpusculum sp.]MDR0459977.1 hypothetical protein [Nitrososphaerota archaeon]
MSEHQVTVSYEPFQEIVIMEKNHFSSPDELARFTSIIAGGKLAGLYWADGVIFLYFPISASTTVVAKELLEKRKVYWSYLGYAVMPKFVPIIETKEKMIVPVVDISSDSILRGVANWVKQQT